MPYDNLDASSFGDRQMQILGALFNGRVVPESIDWGRMGLAAATFTGRASVLAALYRVMRRWCRVPPMPAGTSQAAHKLICGSLMSEREMRTVEYGLAEYYVDCYVTVFGRAPLLPHGL